MYLVSPDYLNGKAKQPPVSLFSKEAKMPGTPPPPLPKKKRTNKKSKSKRIVKNNKKKERASDEWVKLRARLQGAEFERKRAIKTIADFLKKSITGIYV
jgi:hypothetical protein